MFMASAVIVINQALTSIQSLSMTQTGKFVLHNRDLGCAILEQNARPDHQTRRFGQMFQTRILAKHECEMLLCNLESAPNAHHLLTKRATGGKERKHTKSMKHDTKNARKMCLQGLDTLNLRV